VDYRPGTDPHWQNGVTYPTFCRNQQGDTTYDESIAVTGTGGPPPPPPPKTNNIDKQFRGATPFTTYVEFDCAPVGNEDAMKQTLDALSHVESWQAERALWTGVSGQQEVVFPHLAGNTELLDSQNIILQTAAVVVTGSVTALHVVEALGALEGRLADCSNGVGIIHIPQFALPIFDAYGLVRTNGPTLKTLNGNKVVVGAGYPGTSPSGAAPAAGTSWVYATGPIFEYRGEIKTFRPDEMIDRGTNTMRMIAERTYVLGWDCCHIAALVKLSTTV
jgi:hypothetical protein